MAVDNYVLVTSDSLVISAIAMIEDNSVIQSADSGSESRIRRESFPRRRWQLGWHADEVETVESLYEVNGRHTGFLIYAPRERDHSASSQTMAAVTGSATRFQLQITRTNGIRSASKYILHPKN